MKLAKAVNVCLLDNADAKSQKKIPSTVEFCSTQQKKMAGRVLLILDPVTYTESSLDNPFLSLHLTCYKEKYWIISSLYRYESTTLSCCNHCKGELVVP